MSQPGMRITVDAAMRARDVSRIDPDGTDPARPPTPATPAEPARPRKGERRRLGKRAANTRKTGPHAPSPKLDEGTAGTRPESAFAQPVPGPPAGSGGSSPVSS
jgi:hypothetical protein